MLLFEQYIGKSQLTRDGRRKIIPRAILQAPNASYLHRDRRVSGERRRLRGQPLLRLVPLDQRHPEVLLREHVPVQCVSCSWSASSTTVQLSRGTDTSVGHHCRTKCALSRCHGGYENRFPWAIVSKSPSASSASSSAPGPMIETAGCATPFGRGWSGSAVDARDRGGKMNEADIVVVGLTRSPGLGTSLPSLEDSRAYR